MSSTILTMGKRVAGVFRGLRAPHSQVRVALARFPGAGSRQGRRSGEMEWRDSEAETGLDPRG